MALTKTQLSAIIECENGLPPSSGEEGTKMPETYEASLNPNGDYEVVYSLLYPQNFRLADEAEVTLCFSPADHEMGYSKGKWGNLKRALREKGVKFSFWIVVEKGVWECTPRGVAYQLDDKIQRRNRQIEALRRENRKLREKLSTQPARS